MAKQKPMWLYIGTDDLVGATITKVFYNEMELEKDGRRLRIELEYEDDFHSMCDGDCHCNGGSAYFRAQEFK